MNQIKMQIPAQNQINYEIHVDQNLLSHPEKWLSQISHHKKLVIITDETVNQIYGKKLSSLLSDFNPLVLSFSPGEKSKQAETKQYLEEKMIEHRCNRETVILALGGGVVGDMAGFVASTYMRGIPYIQIPTTLLAMVDSSVGGKTGINTSHGKNLIGAFWQPQSVIADIDCLTSLPKDHMINGLIEAIKMFLTNDRNNLAYVSSQLENFFDQKIETLKYIVSHAIKIKADIVMKDEKENHQRMILNFGHTIGHALEKITNYNLLHGYAVALGILVEAKISELSGLLTSGEYESIKTLFARLGITSAQLREMDTQEIIMATKVDKKIRHSDVRYVLLKNIGEVYERDNQFAHAISDEMVKQAIGEVQHDRQ